MYDTIPDSEFKVDVFRGDGVCVRVTHMPSGMVVDIGNAPSERQAFEAATRAIRERLALADDDSPDVWIV